MKKIIFILGLIFLTFVTSEAQNTTTDLYLTKSGSNLKLKIDDNISKATQLYGNPSNIDDYQFEMEGKNGKVYTYQNNDFYVIDGNLYSFEIINQNAIIGLGTKTFKIGDKIKTVTVRKRIGPERWNTRQEDQFIDQKVTEKSGTIRGINYSYYLILRFNNSDSRLELYFDSGKNLKNISYETF